MVALAIILPTTSTVPEISSRCSINSVVPDFPSPNERNIFPVGYISPASLWSRPACQWTKLACWHGCMTWATPITSTMIVVPVDHLLWMQGMSLTIDVEWESHLVGLDLLESGPTLFLNSSFADCSCGGEPSPQHPFSYPSSLLLLLRDFTKWICFTKVL